MRSFHRSGTMRRRGQESRAERVQTRAERAFYPHEDQRTNSSTIIITPMIQMKGPGGSPVL